MRLLNINIKGLALFQKGINIDLTDIVSITGDNASGKTYLLNTIAFVFDFLNSESINHIKTKSILDNSTKVNITVIYVNNENRICKLKSEIIKIEEEEYTVNKESFFIKQNNKFNLVREREENEFLQYDSSISLFLNNKERFYFRMNDDSLIKLKHFPELIKKFDKSIEKFYFDLDFIKIKFYNQKEIITNLAELPNYLSYGTLKGVNTFINANLVIKNNGYFLIDEFECYLNKTMVKELINAFKNKANIIFTTNYLDFTDEKVKTFLVKNKEMIVTYYAKKIIK